MPDENAYTCVSCGHVFIGRYCSECGEKLVEPQERTLRYFFGQVINAFTFADNKIWKTIKYLFVKPGVLPLAYVRGQRKGFLSPLSLFLLINVFYFVFSPVDTFNSYFHNQMSGQPYSALIHDYGLKVSHNSGLAEGAFEKKYNDHANNTSKSIILLLPILFAFPVFGLFYQRSAFLFDHLMFSISFMSFILLGVFLMMPAVIMAIVYLSRLLHYQLSFDWNGTLAIALLLLSLFTYLGIGLKNFYKQKWSWILLKTIALIPCFIVVMFVYRFILFFLTICTL